MEIIIFEETEMCYNIFINILIKLILQVLMPFKFNILIKVYPPIYNSF